MTSPRAVGWICASHQLINQFIPARRQPGACFCNQVGNQKYMNMLLLKEMENEAI